VSTLGLRPTQRREWMLRMTWYYRLAFLKS
jgi:hypothetical protein